METFKKKLSLGRNILTSRDKNGKNPENKNEIKNNIENMPEKPIDDNKNSNKKKKKHKDLEIISINLKKSTQNLNQPDVFYAGLFRQLITKGDSNQIV